MPPPITSTQSSLTFVEQVGEGAAGLPYQTVEIDSGGVPVPLTFSLGAPWLNVIDRFTLTPAPVQVGVIQLQTPMAPGQYNGSFTVGSPGGSVHVPVILLVEPGPVAPPVVASVVNAASGIPGAVSPGEIVSIRGYGVGASAVSSAIGTNLNGLQVTFDGTPATVFYTSANQTNLVVPQGVSKSTVMQVTYASAAGTAQPAAWVLPVVGVTPGIFTVDGTGTGQGAIVNQDGTVNSAANPAARGSVVSIYMTGQGGASPALRSGDDWRDRGNGSVCGSSSGRDRGVDASECGSAARGRGRADGGGSRGSRRGAVAGRSYGRGQVGLPGEWNSTC